jgi:hypothetical protein
MVDRSELGPWLVLWGLVCAVTLAVQWSRRTPSVGLPLTYLLSLSMIHLLGGVIYALPWYEPQGAYLLQAGVTATQVATGFVTSAYGVIGFGLGSIFLAPWIVMVIKPAWLREIPQRPALKLPTQLLQIGLFFFLVVSPLSRIISGLQAISAAGLSLFVAALCLACWQAWQQRDGKQFILWLAMACSLPLVTIGTIGFIGYGAAATLVVLTFVSSFYQPRWQTLVAAGLVVILGLSIYVTYMRDRGDIRTTVWGGQDFQSRYEVIAGTFRNFQIIDFQDQDQLEAIDGRLNQNGLVGKSVEYITDGRATFARGATLLEAMIAPIPRLLWPDKPVMAGSGNLARDYTGQSFSAGTSVGVGQVMEFYLNFGFAGVFLGFLTLGVILRVMDIVAAYKLICGNYWGFLSWFLPALGLIQPGGSLVEVVGSTAAAAVLIWGLRFFLNPQRQPHFHRV